MYQEFTFSESQKFKQTWLWLSLIVVNTSILISLFNRLFSEQKAGDEQITISVLVIIILPLFIVNMLFLLLRLDTGINDMGVYYRFYPFQLSYKRIEWVRISNAYIRKYNPILEYGGWGIRIGLFGKGRAFNVSGNKGLQLVYDNNKKFLIGTKKPDEITAALQQLGHISFNRIEADV